MSHEVKPGHRRSVPFGPAGARALGIALGVALDAAVGDPRRGHPVAAFGTWAGWLEGRLWADSRPRGTAFAAAAVAPPVLLAAAAERATATRPLARVALTAAVTWACLGGTSLRREGAVMAGHLERDDLPAARARLGHLCGRQPDGLDASELARATVESVAENANDAVVAPLWWAAVFGTPGIVAHRAVNTLDAMVGHLRPRYARFGTASALADDALGWLPARVTGALACALAPVAGGSRARALATMRRDAHDHPSPNGGWCESAWAGALGVRLGGENRYPGGRVERRGLLGDGPRPGAADVRRATRLLGAVTAAAAAGAVAIAGASR